MYTQISTTLIPLLSPTPPVLTPLPSQAQGISDFHNSPRVTWSHIMLSNKVIMQIVNTPLTTFW